MPFKSYQLFAKNIIEKANKKLFEYLNFKILIFSVYVAVLDGHDDLACIADADGFDNTPQ